MRESLVYLASPFSHPDPAVCEERFRSACACVAELMREGLHVFSPIAYGYALTSHGVSDDWAAWKAFDRLMLSRCDELIVLCLPGWKESIGVREEITYATELGLPARFIFKPEQPRGGN